MILIAHHEPFEDELNVWMILHNVEGFAMWRHIWEDGNPPGFFLLLLPFVKAGLSYISVQSVCWFSCVLAVFFLNRFSPFPAYLNILITFSAPMLYVYPVIARCYSLLPLLIFSAAWLYSCHVKTGNTDTVKTVIYLLLLAAIAQNHVIMFAFAGGMFVLFLYESYIARERRPSVIIAASITFTALAAIVLQCVASVKTNLSYLKFNDITFESLKNVLVPFFSCFFDMTNGSMFYNTLADDSMLLYILLFIPLIIFFILLFYLFNAGKKYAVILILSVLFPIYIYVTRTAVIFPNRVFTTHIFFIFFFWIIMKKADETAKKVRGNKMLLFSLSLLFIISIPTGINTAVKDFKGRFSSAENMAAFIQQNIPDDGESVLISVGNWLTAGVVYYLGDRPVYAMNGRRIRYIDMDVKVFENKLQESGLLNGKKYVFIIVSKGFLDEDKDRETLVSAYTLVYKTPKSMLPNEDFYLYRIP
jgi:hypothetical protein